jgi:pectinesterase
VLITGINEIDGNSSLNVYPNPFSDKVFIAFSLEAGKTYSLVIYNALGEEIEILQQGTKNAGGNEVVEFSANGLEKGIYFCKLITAENVVIHKIIHTN